MHVLYWKPMTWSLGVFVALTFVVCVVYGLLVAKAFHMTQFLEIALPGFQWLSLGAIVLGLVESFLYGAYAGLVYMPIHNFLTRRFGVRRIRPILDAPMAFPVMSERQPATACADYS